MSKPTTTLASWVNIQPNGSSATPDAYVADALGDYVSDYDVAAMTSEFLTTVQAKLPPELQLLGNGELVGPAFRAWERDPVEQVREAIDDVDFASLMEAHDLTQRAVWVVTYRIAENGLRVADPIDREQIDDQETAHQVLRDLDSDLSAENVGGEYGAMYDTVVEDGDHNELCSARVYAR